MPGLGLTTPAPIAQLNVGGVMNITPLSTLLSREKTAAQSVAAAMAAANTPVVGSLAGMVRSHWGLAKRAKQDVEKSMLSAIRSRRGEYDPDKASEIKQNGQTPIYMMIFATKARQMKSLLVDVLVGSGSEKPWTLSPSPNPELPPEVVKQVMQMAYEEVLQAEMSGMPVSVADVRQRLNDLRRQVDQSLMEQARLDAEHAERRVEDVLVEGGYLEALDQFIDDLTTFKSAFIKGPVVRNVDELTWSQGPNGSVPVVGKVKKLFWERVDPLKIYPAPWARHVNDAFLFELHSLSREALSAMIGVDGYSEDAIRAVLDAHGTGGLKEWTTAEAERSAIEGQPDTTYGSDLIDALQYWGSVSGKMLREWGMSEQEVPDEAKEYPVEAWLIGQWVIKAVINTDPLARRPYYSDGFNRVPGAFWHESLYDVVRDCQDMCNAAARALAGNLGIASGPQVVVNVERLADGEELTELFPWKIWQTKNDPTGSTAAPISFFQPGSHAAELMGVFERFSQLADEYSGIPKYMAGLAGGEGGAGRTASGMSMMITNASKQVKQTVASMDLRVIGPSVGRCYTWLLQYRPDLQIRGDLQARARGALSLIAKESGQVRLNEFLMTTANPVDMQIIGLDGRAELLRHAVKRLDVNTDKVVPSATVVKARAAQAMQAQIMQQQAAGPTGNGQELMDGAPVVDNFQPA